MPNLRQFLDRLFSDRGGALPFDEFMAAALYDPTHGYYTAGIEEVGGCRGDFATAATLSQGLGRAIAGWIGEEIAHHAWRGPAALIEIGGGNGALAASVLKSLGWLGRRRIRYHLVEVSPVLREKQQTRLGRSVAAWHTSPAEALEAAGGRALIFSNELIDAFPAKWLRFEAGIWHEIWVRHETGKGLREEFRELPPDLDASRFSALSLPDPREGQRVEVLPSCRHWLGEWAGAWREGSMLTVDYGGATAAEIYVRRPGGTLRGYFRHERVEGAGVYARFGKQDLTADVSFADLVAWGRELGIEAVALSPQRRFLERFGCGTDVMAGSEAGETFQVLVQRR